MILLLASGRLPLASGRSPQIPYPNMVKADICYSRNMDINQAAVGSSSIGSVM